MENNKNYFTDLNKIECEKSDKNGLTYVSWADAWAEVKKVYPDSNFTIYENADGFPFWESKFGIDVKVGVTINNIEHIVRLPVMDGANKAMKAESYEYTTKYDKKTVQAATQFDINKSTQRAFTKAIAMHGIGLYVFRGEDLPEDMGESQKEPKGTPKPAPKPTPKPTTQSTAPTSKGEIKDGKCSKCGGTTIKTSAKGNQYCGCWYN